MHSEIGREIAASGLRLESKKHAVAFHWRGVPYEAIAPIVELFRALFVASRERVAPPGVTVVGSSREIFV